MNNEDFNNMISNLELGGFKIPEIPNIDFDLPQHHMWSDTQFEIIKRYIQEFEATLDEEHEVGLMLTNFGQSITMQVAEISYEESVLMVFKGFVNGKPATIIQHINQLNFMFTTIPKETEKQKTKIGFKVCND